MTEIELKARVTDPEATERAILAIARPARETVKSDVYWKREAVPSEALDRPSRLAAAGAILSFSFALIAAIAIIAGAPKEIAILVCLGGSLLVAGCSFLGMPAKRARGGKETRLRVREEAGATVVTYKRKETRGEIEVNDEREFSIDDRSAFESLIGDLGFAPYIRKEKKTRAFSHGAADGTEVSIELSLVAGLGWFIELEILANEPNEAETARARETLLETLDSCGIERSAIETRYYTDMLAELTRERR